MIFLDAFWCCKQYFGKGRVIIYHVLNTKCGEQIAIEKGLLRWCWEREKLCPYILVAWFGGLKMRNCAC